ncbi:hypothetical protein [Ectopseudomonas oleovorans]|uniref:Uncharacterized protein n=1 Tax=Ectopseudomonas oleovorans TaxID=301 RepID=A0A3D9EV18_ECTOL|nr:hypothetical protein [Pseudomonas oleovorans]RED06974.1 hypothetical protein DFO60_1480 [Pseudomonas oleovorans]
MEKMLLRDVNAEAVLDGPAKVGRLKRQAALLFGMLKRQSEEEDAFYPMGVKVEVASDGESALLETPYAKGRILFEPRADARGPVGLFRLQRSERDSKDDPVWIELARFTLNPDSVVFNANGDELFNLARPYRGQEGDFMTSIVAALAALR